MQHVYVHVATTVLYGMFACCATCHAGLALTPSCHMLVDQALDERLTSIQADTEALRVSQTILDKKQGNTAWRCKHPLTI